MNLWNMYKKLPVFLQALIAAVLSFTLNITVCILLLISTYFVIKNVSSYEEVLGISDVRLENMFNTINNSK